MSAIEASAGPELLERWASGTGKVIAVGDIVRVELRPRRADVKGTFRYTVKTIKRWPTAGGQPEIVEVTVFGGRPGRPSWRTFSPACLHRVRT